MKKAYLFIGLFAVWCLISAWWYMFWVKGLSPEPENIDPHESALAIAEILLMALVSVLLGFAIAWHLRMDALTVKQNEINHLMAERNSLIEEVQREHEQQKKAEHTLDRARETFREDFFTATREKERLQEALENAQREIKRLQNELLSTQTSGQKLQKNNIQLERTLHKEKLSKHDLEVHQSDRVLEATQIEKEDIDDLKEIKGIGPVIEKKLNILGIVNFKQVSELTEEDIKRIAHTVKFFPDRIKRDQWVKQATELYKLKTSGIVARS